MRTKLNIDEAHGKLQAKGYGLTGKGHFDMASMTARYEVRRPDGTTLAMSSQEIMRLLK